MTLITWNCQGAFRNKYPFIFAHHPDILIIQESEHTNKLTYSNPPTQSLWYGDNPHKGISIQTFGTYTIKPHKSHNPDLKYIIPLTVTGEGQTFILLAIWANNAQDPEGRYIEQVWKALHYYEKLLKQPIILTGDFNSNTIWDKPRREGNHTAVVNQLAKRNIHSIYHQQYQQAQGKEAHPTFYLQRKKEKPYHIDYCFASQSFCERLSSIQMGEYEEWIGLSDHMPLIIRFNTNL